MREVPNDIVSTLLRCLPIIIESVDVKNANTRLRNAIRLTNKATFRLNKIEENGKQQKIGNKC